MLCTECDDEFETIQEWSKHYDKAHGASKVKDVDDSFYDDESSTIVLKP